MMGKGNNKPRKGPPKGVIPPQFKDTVAKPGDVKNPLGINRKPTAFDKLCEMLEDQRTITLEDGTQITLDREQQGLLKLVNKFRKGPVHEINDPNWRFAVDEILSRRMPKPREPLIDQRTINVSATVLAQTFTDQLREIVGRDNITSGDVLDALESDAFATSDSPPGGADG